MVSFDICENNIGCLTFLMEAYDKQLFYAERGFQRMQDNNIKGSRLYMLWNDCCNRDTEKTLKVMNNCGIDFIKNKINYEHGRGFNITDEEIRVFLPKTI